MRLILVLFILVSSSSYGQDFLLRKIDFNVSNVNVDKALDKLSDQAGIDIAYSKNFFSGSPPISLDLSQQTIQSILNDILHNLPIDYKTLGENRVLLFKRQIINYALNGYIEDKETGERIIGAKVYCAESQNVTISNEYGYYNFFVPKGKITLIVHSIGFKEQKINIDLLEDRSIDLKMDVLSHLPTVVVSSVDSVENRRLVQTDGDGIITMNPRFIRIVSSFVGEPDLVRATDFLPGVQHKGDGFGGISVRGNESGQNLLLLDGAPVYIPYHLLGLYSIFNPSTVKSTKVLRGNFPSRYGGATSSIIDVRTKEGNLYKWKGDFEANLINTSALIEGPIKKEKGSILIAGRFSPSAFLIAPTIKRLYFQNQVDTLKTKFYDVNLKANYKLGKKDRVYLSLFSGGDQLYQRTVLTTSSTTKNHFNFELNWQNTVGSFRWNHLFNKKLFVNTTITLSDYNYRLSSLNEFNQNTDTVTIMDRFVIDNRTRNLDLGFKVDFDYLVGKKNNLRFGAKHNYRVFSPNFYFLQETEFDVNESAFQGVGTENYDFNLYYEERTIPFFRINETALYVEDHLKLRRFYFNFGLRLSAFNHEKASFVNFEPRFIGNYSITEKFHFSASFNRRIQALHLISNPSIQLPNDLWIPSTEERKPQELYETELSLNYAVNKNLNLTLTGYQRWLNQVYSHPETLEFLYETEDYTTYDYLLEGSGINRGIEFSSNYASQKNGINFSYILSESKRQFDSLNLGNTFHSNFDSRHQFKLTLFHKFDKHITAGFNWVYNSPKPQVNVLSFITDGGVNNLNQDPPGLKNTTRNRTYNRIDFNVQINLSKKKSASLYQNWRL